MTDTPQKTLVAPPWILRRFSARVLTVGRVRLVEVSTCGEHRIHRSDVRIGDRNGAPTVSDPNGFFENYF